jgi:hypothetical protein
MNKVACYIIFLLYPLILFSQEKKAMTLDEITVSGNYTLKGNYDSEGRFGFGAGIYHIFLKDHMFNVLLGIEYNRTTQFFSYLTVSGWDWYEDATFHFNYLSFPLEARIKFGRKAKLFLEGGGYLDFPLYSHVEGTYHYRVIIMDTTDIPDPGFVKIDEKYESYASAGVILGAGIIIPFSHINLIVKSDYKFGHSYFDFYDGDDRWTSQYIRLSAGIRFNHTDKKPAQFF